MQIESFSNQMLQGIIPAYLYEQYADDFDLQAFVSSLNSLSQGYLDWFNQNPLGVYTNANISGPLLDWVGNGLYGIERPIIGTLTTTTTYSSFPFEMTSLAFSEIIVSQSGTAQVLNDDYYKRVLTWHLYLGDGRQMSIPWLRNHVARFLYGSNGTDVSIGYGQYVTIKPLANQATPEIDITVPNTPAGQSFQLLVKQGWLALPFQFYFKVILG